MFPKFFLLSYKQARALAAGLRGGGFPAGCPKFTGVMQVAGSKLSVSNQFLACCGVGPSLSIIQELENICCLTQALLLFNRTKPCQPGKTPHPGLLGLQLQPPACRQEGHLLWEAVRFKQHIECIGKVKKRQTEMNHDQPEFVFYLSS